MIYTGSKSLQYLRIPVYTIFKNLTIILIAYGEVIWFGGKVTRLMLMSFGLMVLSSVVAGWTDVSDTLSAIVGQKMAFAGYIWMAANCFSSAAFVLYMRKRIKQINFRDFDTVYYNNLLSIPLLIIPSFLLEDWSTENLNRTFPSDVRQQMVFAMIFSGVSAFVMSYASAWCVRTTSSTTYSMVGALNKLPLALSGIVLFDDPATFPNITAILIGQTLPLQTIRQRLYEIWQSLTWPVILKILKADIAVTVALGLLMIEPIREKTQVGIVFASVAVEFVHPSKSYGMIAESIGFGAIMCSLAAGWSLLGTYCVSLARDPTETRIAQPKMCAIAAMFEFFGAVGLNYVRVKVDQANVGGQLTKLLECFDGIARRQVDGFLHVGTPEEHSLARSHPEPLAKIHQILDSHIEPLVSTKRVVRREIGLNYVAPVDVAALTKVVKAMRVPLQGIGLSRVMESNMRKAEIRHRLADRLKTFAARDELDPPSARNNVEDSIRTKNSDSDLDTGSDSEDHDDYDPYGEEEELPKEEDLGLHTSSSSTPDTRSHPQTATEGKPYLDGETVRMDQAAFTTSAWRKEYNELMSHARPLYLELVSACTDAVDESIKRLYRMQRIDPRLQDKPFFYRFFHKLDPLPEPRNIDPSLSLLAAIERFDRHRLDGLDRLYSCQSPRRILFLLLLFQYNVREYCEKVYTLSSLIYEMDNVRTKRKIWTPHFSLRKFLRSKTKTEEDFDLDVPKAVAENNPLTLQRTLTHRTAMLEMEEPHSRLFAPSRGIVGQKESQVSGSGSLRDNKLDPLTYHDPDVAFPATPFQRFCYKIYVFSIDYLYTAETLFALRVGILVMLLSLPAYINSSVGWYNDVRGQWSVVVALIWMGPSMGSNFFGTVTRTVGSFIGAICAIIIWEASRGTAAGILVLTFVFNLPFWFIYIKGQFWRPAGMFSLITISLIIGYTYNHIQQGQTYTIGDVAWQRLLSVVVGVAGAHIMSVFPFPTTGRVELRRRIANTLGEFGALYSSFLALVLKNSREDEAVRLRNRKIFDVLSQSIRRQIKGARVLLEQSRFEPALRGVFPEDKYLHILQILDNILHIMLAIENAMEKTNARWRAKLVKSTWRERKELVLKKDNLKIASFLTAFQLGANALVNKTSLPPYVLRPTRARLNLTMKVRTLSHFTPDRLRDQDFTYYSAYLMNSEQLAVEIEQLIATIRDLVGPDSVSRWLDYRH
ncbi:GDP-mannose transporter into the lumen of the Golgi [Apophysomyces ossiformis]|uniref:GDP-mannose transporter into the lumen of the Golgi n=1 Tax=Apophysomyces ossiformis TaxID=679940 RepID=A0A8H7BG19_9FUNG|nr:GDP-mannose transporter into the lumen of the Golgi [Apophysomyces ossiformis]